MRSMSDLIDRPVAHAVHEAVDALLDETACVFEVEDVARARAALRLCAASMIAWLIAAGIFGIVPSSSSSQSLMKSTPLSAWAFTACSASATVATGWFTPASPP